MIMYDSERKRERVKNAIFCETIWLLKYIIFNLIMFLHFVYCNLGPKRMLYYELNLSRNPLDFGSLSLNLSSSIFT